MAQKLKHLEKKAFHSEPDRHSVFRALCNLRDNHPDAYAAFFGGMGWPDGANACRHDGFAFCSAAPILMAHYLVSAKWLLANYGG